MTIVLQHQYWDLEVDEDGFAVTLSFNDQMQRLRIPFTAIKVFADPGVEFGLQFTLETRTVEPPCRPSRSGCWAASAAQAAASGDGAGGEAPAERRRRDRDPGPLPQEVSRRRGCDTASIDRPAAPRAIPAAEPDR